MCVTQKPKIWIRSDSFIGISMTPQFFIDHEMTRHRPTDDLKGSLELGILPRLVAQI